MNLEILNQQFEVKENPGLDTTDPRLDEISALVQQGEYLDAANLAETLLANGIQDIRIVGFFAYGVFLERGVGVLGEVFSSLAGLLRNNWAAFGPVNKREKHAQTSLRWFVNQLLKKLQYEENAKSISWEDWTSAVSSEQVQEILDGAEEFRHALTQVLEDGAPQVADGLVKTIKWLQSFQQLVYRQPESEPEPEQEAPTPGAYDADYSEEVQPEETPSTSYAESFDTAPLSRPSQPPPAQESGRVVEGSYHLEVLMRKMEAFERLIADGKLPQAAMVADDINEIIASFDPRLYFPKLFSRFAYLQALNIGELASYEEHKQSVEWLALKEYYKVDLEGFLGY
jgi:hypothetical protein